MKAGIIGIGKLGSVHLRIYKEIKEIEKVYLVDNDETKLSPHQHLSCLTDYRRLPDDINLVSIATPTSTHFEIAQFFLAKNIPVLVEKPITSELEQANQLIALSQTKKTLLFVGHVERYNSAYLAVKELIKNPLFIECHRLSPYPNRSLDIGVVLDLMIHDLDIILGFLKEKVKKIDAKGIKILSASEDLANARIVFAGGCVANITASRISAKKERKIRIFMHNCYISLDYAAQSAEIYQKSEGKISHKILDITKEEPLKREIIDFVNLVKQNNRDTKYARDAKNALSLALKIQEIIS